MKKLMSLGCLLALVFAGASAFADANGVWFTADLTNVSGSPWTSIPTSWDAENQSFNDWTTPLTYTAASASVSDYDATIITSVKFTAIDGTDTAQGELPEDLTSVPVNGAKAGLTIVQTGDTAFQYYGLVPGATPTWVALGSVMTALPADAVTVKVALCKLDTGAIIKYSVDDVLLLPNDQSYISAGTVTSFQSISYLGNCPEIASLTGNKYSNAPAAKESINPTKAGVPTTISYNRQDLLERGIDPDSETAVVTYLTTARANGLCGWVNTALGIDDDHTVAVESNLCAQGSISLDYGFLANGTGTITYQVDTDDEKSNSSISTEASGIHTVKVYVTGEDGETKVQVAEQKVGVMNTGKDTTEMVKGGKTYDIVAVPFAAFKGNVTVANVLNTAELTSGDALYILNGGKYDTFVLNANKKWEAVGETSYSRQATVVANPTAPEAYILTPGVAIWIERDVDSKIVFAGHGEVDQEHTWTWTSGEYSLVANPTVNDFKLPLLADFNDEAAYNAANFGKDGDMIIVEDISYPKQFEKRNGVWGELITKTTTVRGKTVSKLEFTAGGTIPPGIGFWYYNKGGAGAVTINFGTNAQ